MEERVRALYPNYISRVPDYTSHIPILPGNELPSKHSPTIQRNGLPRKTGLSRSQLNLTESSLSAFCFNQLPSLSTKHNYRQPPGIEVRSKPTSDLTSIPQVLSKSQYFQPARTNGLSLKASENVPQSTVSTKAAVGGSTNNQPGSLDYYYQVRPVEYKRAVENSSGRLGGDVADSLSWRSSISSTEDTPAKSWLSSRPSNGFQSAGTSSATSSVLSLDNLSDAAQVRQKLINSSRKSVPVEQLRSELNESRINAFSVATSSALTASGLTSSRINLSAKLVATVPTVAMQSVRSVEVAKPLLQHAAVPDLGKLRKAATITTSQFGRVSESPGTYQTPSPTVQEYVTPEPVGPLATGRCEPVPSAKALFRHYENGGSPVAIISSPAGDHTSESSRNSNYGQLEQEKPRECYKTVRSCSSEAFKFYMEQHMENVIKTCHDRQNRKRQLEKELAKSDLGVTMQETMRAMLIKKESNYMRQKRAQMKRSDFVKIRTIGMGAFGEVALVRKYTGQQYAMKTLRKVDVVERNQIAHVKAERDILAEAENEWVVKLFFSFQDAEHLYFVMEFVPGGDLMHLLEELGRFEEPLARFYIAELVSAIGSVHAMGFIHRDIKPDNILIDRYGHLKLTDFGLCTGFRWTHKSQNYNFLDGKNHQGGETIHVRTDSLAWQNRGVVKTVDEMAAQRVRKGARKGPGPLFQTPKSLIEDEEDSLKRQWAHSQVGTPNYMAPEVLQSNDHAGYTQVCDWWSVGVILYEMLCGRPPFFSPSPQETQQKVISWRKHLSFSEYEISIEASDLITRLCCDPVDRLGNAKSELATKVEQRNQRLTGAEEIKQHPFFRHINWSQDLRRQRAPYIPTVRDRWDTSNFDSFDESNSPFDVWRDDDEKRDSMVSPRSGSSSSPHKATPQFYEFTFRRFFDTTDDAEFQSTPVQEPCGNSRLPSLHESLDRQPEQHCRRTNGPCEELGPNLLRAPPDYCIQQPPPYSAVTPSPTPSGLNSEGLVKSAGKSRDHLPVYV